MRCSGVDTGPNNGPCQNEATTRNIIGQECCKSCAELSNRLIQCLNALAPQFGLEVPFPMDNN